MEHNQKLYILGLLSEKRELLKDETVRIERLSKDIAFHIAIYNGIEEIKLDAAEQEIQELRAAMERYGQLKKEIAQLEKEV